ncbi:hypothetical protein [Nodosilinea sp. FACHB-13]|uniref:hypothetical protein n=1 Tax=Cyanophyceae TaxID=3028117 RepID=UPI00168324CA|nr:hypothetical protein [Nodosilinea sp. FACHB-13]MBD2108096.1 hypothetical protein [Nodosilinea sp. FACHB-13]
MKPEQKRLLTTIAVSLLMVTSAACTPNPSTPENDDLESNAEPLPAESETAELEAQANLQTFDETANSIPITARYPDTMEVTSSSSDEGLGAFFDFKPQNTALDEARVQVFLPAGGSSLDDLIPFVTGPNGLLEINGWTLREGQSNAALNAYPWVERVFDFSTEQQQAGHVLVGEAAGQAVQVILLYPTAMTDAYWPAAKTILDSLAFEPSLLPIEASSEGEDPATVCDPTKEPC